MWDRTVVGWKGYADHDGNEIPYSEEAKAQLIKIPYVRAALNLAYGELTAGRAAARKN
jgi:hypothetical protein